ncbi:hypothetical protein [Dapis sp. BLCC M172]
MDNTIFIKDSYMLTGKWHKSEVGKRGNSARYNSLFPTPDM